MVSSFNIHVLLQNIFNNRHYNHSFPLHCKAQKSMKKAKLKHSITYFVLKYA